MQTNDDKQKPNWREKKFLIGVLVAYIVAFIVAVVAPLIFNRT